MDNRPLTFNEFHNIIPQVIYLSATPAEFEIRESEGVVVEQIISEIPLEPEGDVRYPDFDRTKWIETIREQYDGFERVFMVRA